MPEASLVDTEAMGKPVALEARAEERGRAGIDFNDDDAVVLPVVRELHVRAARDADGVQNAVGVVLKPVLHVLRNGQHGGHAEAVPGVHAHGVHVFNEADGDFLALGVAHDFQFQFFPPQHAFLHQHLVDQGGGQAAGNHLAQLSSTLYTMPPPVPPMV